MDAIAGRLTTIRRLRKVGRSNASWGDLLRLLRRKFARESDFCGYLKVETGEIMSMTSKRRGTIQRNEEDATGSIRCYSRIDHLDISKEIDEGSVVN